MLATAGGYADMAQSWGIEEVVVVARERGWDVMVVLVVVVVSEAR